MLLLDIKWEPLFGKIIQNVVRHALASKFIIKSLSVLLKSYVNIIQESNKEIRGIFETRAAQIPVHLDRIHPTTLTRLTPEPRCIVQLDISNFVAV